MDRRFFHWHYLVIPLELVLALNTVRTTAQLQQVVNVTNTTEDFLNLGKPNSMVNVERKGYVIPQPASCIPELQIVKLGEQRPGVWYFPSCTRVEQCGGCCGRDDVFSCQPVQTEPVNYQVHVLRYVGGKEMILKGKEIVTVNKHTECQCDCIVKESDCNQLQTYNRDHCECTCTNTDEQEKCLNEPHKKYWDPESCSCKCNDVRECNTGFLFNKHSCGCELMQRPRVKFGDIYTTE